MITRRLSLLLSMLAGLMAVMFAASGASAAQGDEKSPVGTWFVYICPGSSDPCSTTSLIINLVSFTKDGITMSADFGANPMPSSGLGVWGKTGPDQFATTYVELLSVANALVSRAKIRGTLKYDHKSDTLAGPFRVDVTDPSGQNVFDHFEGTVLFTRMQLEPLP
jgi:hypothetical protein